MTARRICLLGFYRTERSDSVSDPLSSVDSRTSDETGTSGRSGSHVIAPSTVFAKSKGGGRVSISRSKRAGHTDQASRGEDTNSSSKRSKPHKLTNVSELGDTSRCAAGIVGTSRDKETRVRLKFTKQGAPKLAQWRAVNSCWRELLW